MRALLFMFACAFLLAVTAAFGRGVPSQRQGLVVATVASVEALALTVLFVRWEHLRIADVLGELRISSVVVTLIGFFCGLFLVAVWAAVSGPVGHVRWTRVSSPGLPAVTSALVLYLAVSLREEIAFRGYPLRRLNHVYGLWPAQVIVAVVFATEHEVSGWTWLDALLGAGVGALLFGMAAIATRGIALPIGLHTAWNFGQWSLGLRDSPGFWKSVVEPGWEESSHLTGTFIYVAVLSSATFALWLWHRRHSALTPPDLTAESATTTVP